MQIRVQSEDGTKVELVTPPPGSKIGERVYIDGMVGEGYEPVTSAQMKKKKIWDAVSKKLKTTTDGIATWDDKPIVTSVGPCKAETLVGVPIS